MVIGNRSTIAIIACIDWEWYSFNMVFKFTMVITFTIAIRDKLVVAIENSGSIAIVTVDFTFFVLRLYSDYFTVYQIKAMMKNYCYSS